MVGTSSSSTAAEQNVFDAFPFPAFVVDGDMRLLAMNSAARKSFGDESTILRLRHGEALQCVHAKESGEGCGRSESCGDCVLRSSVTFALSRHQPVRIRARMEYIRDGQVEELHALVTASPLVHEGETRALLFIEDLTVLLAMTDALPICMGCKKVRNEDLWQQIESYLNAHLDLRFTHGICPDCAKKLYPGFTVGDEG